MDLIIIILLFVLILVYSRFEKWSLYNDNKTIGDRGENIVACKLDQLGSNFIVKNNVRYGKTQIDHLVICHEGKMIFVIETKYWGGIITGKYNDKYWHQNKNGQIKYLRNPILQNRYHCRVVGGFYPRYKVVNIVCFVKNRKIPKSDCIVSENNIVDFINKYDSTISKNYISFMNEK